MMRVTTITLLTLASIVACRSDSSTLPAASPFEIVVAFAVGDNVSNGNLYLMTADGRSRRQLLDLPAAEYNPRWSSDGRMLTFAREGVPLINWLVEADGTGLRPMPTPPGDVVPGWSPDSKWIAYFRFTGSLAWELDKARIDGSEAQTVILPLPNDVGGPPEWSVNDRIAFVRRREGEGPTIWTMRLDGSDMIQLTNGENEFAPRWSPDGTRILYATYEELSGYFTERFWVMNADGTGAHPLTVPLRNEFDQHPSWSPDGAWILYGHYASSSGQLSCRFFKIPSNGGTPTPFAPDLPPGRCLGASWRKAPPNGP